jgi:hypothetical protein
MTIPRLAAHRAATVVRGLVALTITAAMLSVSGCGDSGDNAEGDTADSGCRRLAADPGWYGDNRDRINAMIDQLGTCGKLRPETDETPLAVFDWDNTTVKHDTGDATFFWMVRNSKVRQPAGGDWSTTSQYLTAPAAAALASACGALAPPGQPLPTGTDAGCADKLASVYAERQITTGTSAFVGYNHRRIDPSAAWAAQLLAGWTEADVTGFAEAARRENLDAPEGTEFGISADRVMATRTDHDGDVLTSRLTACGGEPSIPYNEGKRCRINEQVFGIQGTAAFDQLLKQRRQVFGAGDSDRDVTFTADATALRLVINRNQIELMCQAYANLDGRWLVNPMFINALRVSPPYPCATQGFDEPNGDQAPLLQPDGSVVPDQQDRVYSK